ncbi:MAG: hypothetical protein ACKVOR_02735 [Flavobacteriales bacterium]
MNKILNAAVLCFALLAAFAATAQDDKKQLDKEGKKKKKTEKAPSPEEIEKEKPRILDERNRQLLTNDVYDNGHFFPFGTVWLNTDGPLALNNFDNKITLIIVTDFHCIECSYYIAALQEQLIHQPAIQILQVVKGSTEAPVRRQSVLQYIQQHGYTHPVAVVPDYSGFQGTAITSVPFFMLYEKSHTPTFAEGGITGYENLLTKLNSTTENKTLMKSCYNYQVQPAILPNWWADPMVENPGAVAIDDEQDRIFLTDFAHNRIVQLDGVGACTQVIGSGAAGFADDYLANSRFNHPRQSVFHDGKLYIADTHNNRIRVADLGAQRVSTLCGNGQFSTAKQDAKAGSRDAFAMPVGLAVFNKKLFGVSAATNEVFEINTTNGACKKLTDLPQTTVNMMRTTPVSMCAMGDFLYISMSDGSLAKVDEQGAMLVFQPTGQMRPGQIANWKGTLVATDAVHNQLLKYGNKGWELMAGDGTFGSKNGDARKSTFAAPTGVAVLNGLLMVSDGENHTLRTLTKTKKGKVKTIALKPSRELIGETAAHTFGETVVMDTITVSRKESKVRVEVDAGKFKILPEWSYADMDDVTGAFLTQAEIQNNTFEFSIRDVFQGLDVYIEVYLLLQHPDNPDVHLVKRSYLTFYIDRQETSEPLQEQIYKVNVLPY